MGPARASTRAQASGSRFRAARCRSSRPAPGSRAPSRAETPPKGPTPFADRLAALEVERRSQVCLGLDPVPSQEPWSTFLGHEEGDARERAAEAIEVGCRRLITDAGPYCVAVKPQLARFEVLGAPGWSALEGVIAAAKDAGLLVIADGKRSDVPVSAEAYADAFFGQTETPWGPVDGLGADAATFNPLLGADSLEPLVASAAAAGAGVFVLVRTSNPGAADLLDADADGMPLHERIAVAVDALADRLAGSGDFSGAGAVVGATEPRFLARLRQLMPRAIFLLPGIGAQGGDAAGLAAAFTGPGSALVTASRSVATASDPAEAAEELRNQVRSIAEA